MSILAGESMHAFGPTGVGFTMALQDAYSLAREVAAKGLTPEALRGYEEGRREVLGKIFDATRESHRQAISAGADKKAMSFEQRQHEILMEWCKGIRPLQDLSPTMP